MSVHSNDGTNTWLTKLKRLSDSSASDKERVFNNLGHLITMEMLKELFYALDRKKAVGIDGITKETYNVNLEGNLVNLMKRLRRGTYQPKPSRLVEIPKEDGSSRPLAISCLEDKLVQCAINKILNAIYEPLFLNCSYGFRPNRSCHDALRALMQNVSRFRNGAVAEIDLRKYFNTIPHGWLKVFLCKKISDTRFLRLIDLLITAPVQNGDLCEANPEGCPQGSIISPCLANIYLHHVIDEWVEQISHSHINGQVAMVRYADDIVFVFEHYSEAERFYQVLPKRLSKYGLMLHEDKSSLIPSGSAAALRAHQGGRRIPTYQFLGFTCYWGKSRNGSLRLKYMSRGDRFGKKLKGLREYLWKNLNTPDLAALMRRVIRVIKGWINYHGISDNHRRVGAFIHQCKKILFRWLNRRGRKSPLNWKQLNLILKSIGLPVTWKTVSMFPIRATHRVNNIKVRSSIGSRMR